MSIIAEKTDLSLKYIAHYNEVKEQFLHDSPEVFNLPRKKALQDFVSQGIPTRKNENYKYSDLQPQFAPEYKFIHQKEKVPTDKESVFRCDVPELDTEINFIINGWYSQNGGKTRLPKGVVLQSLEESGKQNHPALQHYSTLAKTDEDPITALNTVYARDGYFLYVPKNTIVEIPIQVINFLKSDEAAFVTQRNFIYIEQGASVKLVSCDHTLNLNSYLNTSVTEVFVGPNAEFEYYALQNQHNKTTSLNAMYIQQERDSKVTTLTSSLHGGFIRNNLKFVLNGENAEANLYGMAFIDREQHIDNFTQVIHAKPHCVSNQLYKNVLDDKSTGAFAGRIHVVRDAQKTNAFQRNNNLLLTDQATMQTKPQLIIDADDVKCSHGATVGQIDEDALFYLRARGINENKARLMMMNAFAHEVIQKIKVEPLRDRIDELVDKRLRGEVARCHDCAYNCEN